jgi:hypothetical protein
MYQDTHSIVGDRASTHGHVLKVRTLLRGLRREMVTIIRAQRNKEG